MVNLQLTNFLFELLCLGLSMYSCSRITPLLFLETPLTYLMSALGFVATSLQGGFMISR